jgi:hypothetical protein
VCGNVVDYVYFSFHLLPDKTSHLHLSGTYPVPKPYLTSTLPKEISNEEISIERGVGRVRIVRIYY